jgi:hypothetical protein
MHRIVRLGPVVLLALFIGCRDNTAPDQTRSLRLNRLVWENQNLHDYRYTGSMICGECPSNHGPVFVTVLSDTVSSVKLTTTGVEVSKQGWQTVDQLFDYAERQLADKGWTVRVEYDPVLGYPTDFFETCAAVDCAGGVLVKDLSGLVSIY